MQSPFLFGKTVSSESFTNRTKDVSRLKDNFLNNINTILISPRRWGKSSLVEKVAADVHNRNVKMVMIDMFSVRNEDDFYNTFATETIKATSNKLTEWLQAGKQFLKHLTPKISVGADPMQDFEIAFEWNDLQKNYKEVLALPEAIAKAKGLHIVVCIDEFQNLSNFKEPLIFQRRLRSEWQRQKHVCYCLYGSKQHMMMQLFERQSMPFYKFGDVMYLKKIERGDWIKFIRQQFQKTKKQISEDLANAIAAIVQDHSYYVQQLSHQVWITTSKTATQQIIQQAIETVIDQNALLYTRDTEELTTPQVNFLTALAGGVNSGLASKDIIYKYRLGTSANVLKIKKALLNKELIEEHNKEVFFLDPVYQLWFRREMLGKEIEINW